MNCVHRIERSTYLKNQRETDKSDQNFSITIDFSKSCYLLLTSAREMIRGN